MQAADFMIDSNELHEIKLTLIEQSVKRLLDAHLGTYIFEEGEIVELLEPDAVENAARRIAKFNNYMRDYESDESESDESQEEQERHTKALERVHIVCEVLLEEEKEIEEERQEKKEETKEETLYIYDFEGTGEQLRRLRAYNPILADETEDEYNSRIWYIADKEDEEEENKRVNEI